MTDEQQIQPRRVVPAKLGTDADDGDSLRRRKRPIQISLQLAHSSIFRSSCENAARSTSLLKLRLFFGQVSTHWQQKTQRPTSR